LRESHLLVGEMLADINAEKAEAYKFLPLVIQWRSNHVKPFISKNIMTRQQAVQNLSFDPYAYHDELTIQIYNLFDEFTVRLISLFRLTNEYEYKPTKYIQRTIESQLKRVESFLTEIGWVEWRHVNINYFNFAADLEIWCGFAEALVYQKECNMKWDLGFKGLCRFERDYQRRLVNTRKHWDKLKEKKKEEKKSRIKYPAMTNLTEVHPELAAFADCVSGEEEKELVNVCARSLSFSPKYTFKEKKEALTCLVGTINDKFLMEHGITRKRAAHLQEAFEKVKSGKSRLLLTLDDPRVGTKPSPSQYLPKGWALEEAVGFTGKYKSN
jgi:hypothetical protein